MEIYTSITLKLLLGSAVIFIILRLIGKKTSAEITPFDLIYFLVLGGILDTPLYEPNVSIWNVLFALLLWGGWVILINYAVRKTFYVSKILQGEPAVLISEGNINRETLENNQIDLEQLRTMLRQNGCFALHDVEYAVLEIDGRVSIIRKDEEEVPSVLLVDEGRIDEETLESMDHDKDWLIEKLEQEGFSQIEDIFYCEWLPDEGLHVVPYEKDRSKDIKLDG